MKFIIAIVIAIILIVLVVLVAYCYYATHTFAFLPYLLNSRYWCFATLNLEYTKAKRNKLSYADFCDQFTKRYVDGNDIIDTLVHKKSEMEKELLIQVLSQEEFVTSNFGVEPYDIAKHKALFSAWMEWVETHVIPEN